MAITADLYVERESWLHAMDPRVKLVFVALGIPAVLLLNNVVLIGVVLLLTHLLILSAKVPTRRVSWVWRRMLPLNVLIPLLIFVFYPEGPVFLRAGPVDLTWAAAIRGVALVLRLDAIAFVVFAWIFTTDQTKIVRSLVKLGLPFDAGLVLAMSLRYIPMFYGLFATISEAQQARGLDLDEGGFIQRLRKHIPILVAMIISAMRMSDRLARALESRALGLPGVRRTVYRDIAFRPVDYVYLGGLLLLFCAIVYLRFGLGIGTHLTRLWP